METLIKIAVPRRVGSGRNSDSKNERENTEIPKFIDFNRSPQARTENEREIHCHKHEREMNATLEVKQKYLVLIISYLLYSIVTIAVLGMRKSA